jgi:RNA polymerase sigma-32 factor
MPDKRQTPPQKPPDDNGDEGDNQQPDLESDAAEGEIAEPTGAELVDEEPPAELDLPAEGDDDETPAQDDDNIIEPKSRSIARVDPLTAYINDIRRYGLLSREDEHALAVKYLETGDLEAAKRLVTSNLRLVVKIAHEYRRAHRNLLDLIQEGNVGLVQAVKKYDPYRGVKLSSYAAWWIRAYMLKFILNNWRLVKIGTTQAQRKLFFNLRKEKEKLESLGFETSSKALAEALDVPEREVIDMEKRLGQGEMSLDAPLKNDEEGGRSHLDMLESGGDTRPDVATEGVEFRELLREKFAEFEKTLRGRELDIFRERLLTDTPKTLQEIGSNYGISRERARQLEKRLVGKLKTYLRKELGDAVQIAMGLEE